MKKNLVCLFLLATFAWAQAQERPAYTPSGEILENAAKLSQEGSAFAAALAIRKIHPSDTNYVAGLDLLTESYFQGEQYRQALKASNDRLAAQEPMSLEAYVFRAASLHKLDSLDAAVAVYEQAVKEYPYHYLSHYNYGVMWIEREEYRKASACLEEALQLNPYHKGTLLMLGQLALYQGHWARALIAIEAAILIDPDNTANRDLLSKMEAMAKTGFSLDKKASASGASNNEGFEEIDLLLASKAALSSKYKLKTKLGSALTRQTQLLLENIDKVRPGKSVWSRVYAPLLAKVQAKGYFDTYCHAMLASLQTPEVVKGIQKIKKNVPDMYQDLRNGWDKAYRRAQVQGFGKNYELECWYTGDDHIVKAMGELQDGEKTGYWRYYHDNGRLASEGFYEKGEQAGPWRIYSTNGMLRESYTALNQHPVDQYDYYHPLGTLVRSEQYDAAGLETDTMRVYHLCGTLSQAIPYQQGKIEGEAKLYHTTGTLKGTYTYVAGKRQGPSAEYYPSGAMTNRVPYADGEQHGLYEEFHENGQLRLKGMMEKGRQQGTWESFHENGKPYRRFAFDDEAEFQGEFLELDDAGDTLEHSYFEHGEPMGEWREYDPITKKCAQRILYGKDQIDSLIFYDADGRVISAQAGGPSFTAKIYDAKGRLISEGPYEGKKQHGDWAFFHINGQIARTVRFDRGEYDGPNHEYHESGQLLALAHYQEGNRTGYYARYYRNGQIEVHGWLLDGDQDGAWANYYADGKPSSERYFIKGEMTGIAKDFRNGGELSVLSKYRYGMRLWTSSLDTAGVPIDTVYTPLGTGTVVMRHPSGQSAATWELSCNRQEHSMLRWIYADGQTWSEVPFQNDERHGPYVSFFPNGNKRAEGLYEEGEKEGLWKYYRIDGSLRMEIMFKVGKQQGEERQYSYSGAVTEVSQYRNGQLHGLSVLRDSLGNLMAELEYEEGILQRYRWETAPGQRSAWEEVRQEGLDTVRTYYANGKLSREEHTQHGISHGDMQTWHANGQPQARYTYAHGLRDGAFERYTAAGARRTAGSYLNGDYHGKLAYYRADGTLEREEEWRNGEQHGLTHYYAPDGTTVLRTALFWNDFELLYEPEAASRP
jgi:antitoxin component YwqK of YwqJK toxin-antitoxin module/Tfp pilus assembly protein PilF